MKNQFFTFIILVLSYCNTSVAQIPATSYKITDLVSSEIHGRSIQWASSINEKGQVAGTCCVKSSNNFFRWDKESGYSFTVFDGTKGFCPAYTPYINNKGILSECPITDKGDKYSIDNSNRLVKNGIIIERTLKWVSGERLHVNNSGQILGNIKTSNNQTVLIIWDEKDGTITHIYPQLKFDLYPADINDLGWVVGWYSNGINQQGVLWTPEFGPQVIPNFCPTAINKHGLIAGHISLEGGLKGAALWIRGNVINLSKELKIDTNPSTELLLLTEISDINDQGQMVGWGMKNGGGPGNQQAVVITPIN